MGAESAYFVAGLVGILAGYIVGDFQRELRWRRDARENLRLAVDRLPVPVAVPDYSDDFDVIADAGSNSDRDRDGSPVRSIRSIRDGQARRRAVSRPNYRDGADPSLRGRRSSVPAPQAVGAGYDCG